MTHKKAILDATYAVDGVIVISGVDGKAISSPDPDAPVKVTGRELVRLGLDPVALLHAEMLVPLTNQMLVDKALQYFEEGKHESWKADLGANQSRAGVRRRRYRR